MENSQRTSFQHLISKLPLLSPSSSLQPSSVQSNFGDFIYRDAISRKQYQYKILQVKKKKLTINQLKHPYQSLQTKSVIKDVGGHLQILSNIKQFRFHELLSSSKEIKKLKEEISKVELEKYNEYKQSLLRIRANMIQSIKRENIEYFRKYLGGGEEGFNERLGIMKRIESNKITQEELERFLRESQEEGGGGGAEESVEEQEKRRVGNQRMVQEIEEEFEGKYRKQYNVLEKDIKNKINSHIQYLIQPQNINYKSVKPSIKPHPTKPLSLSSQNTPPTPQQQFLSTLSQIQSKSLTLLTNLSSLNPKQSSPPYEPNINFLFLKSLILQDNTFDLKCEINDRPEYIELKDEKGNTLLHVAAKESRLAAVKVLLECGVDKMAKNKLGYGAEETARHFGEEEIAREIEGYERKRY